jgi:hypothetical protein
MCRWRGFPAGSEARRARRRRALIPWQLVAGMYPIDARHFKFLLTRDRLRRTAARSRPLRRRPTLSLLAPLRTQPRPRPPMACLLLAPTCLAAYHYRGKATASIPLARSHRK